MVRKKILITGALGYIGSRLIRNLSPIIAKDVIILDNLANQRYPSLFGLPKGFSYKFIRENLTTVNLAEHLDGVDIVVHLANKNFYEKGLRIPKEIEIVNFLNLKRVADACLKKKVKLIFPSTTNIYGSRSSSVDEDCQELNPQTPHTREKLASERYLKKLGKQGLEYVICRFGIVFGYSPGMRFDTVINKFILQTANGEPLTVWRTAWKQKRSYLYLGDCIRAINFIIKKDLFSGQVYNIKSGDYTLDNVIKAIKSRIPDLKITFVDSPIMDRFSYRVIDKKFRNLGFRPQGKLSSGIQETVNKLAGII